MILFRQGNFGDYYGSPFDGSAALPEELMKTNARYIYSYFKRWGWTDNSIFAMLGNMTAESTINPGRWQSDNIGNTSGGYGLVQWTPATKYFEFSEGLGYTDPSDMDSNLDMITLEWYNELQWIPTSEYNFTFMQFSKSTLSVSELAKAFLLNYERPADQSEAVQNYRALLSVAWQKYLTGSTPIGHRNKKKSFNFVLFNERRKRKWTNRHF